MKFTTTVVPTPRVNIQSLKRGAVFRLGNMSMPEALSTSALYMKTGTESPGSCVHLGLGELVTFPASFLVYTHTATLNIDS